VVLSQVKEGVLKQAKVAELVGLCYRQMKRVWERYWEEVKADSRTKFEAERRIGGSRKGFGRRFCNDTRRGIRALGRHAPASTRRTAAPDRF